jgi:Methylase involved in ubiquinone/menaquinone biosynthesis
VSEALYDDIGRRYAQARIPDARIAAQIHGALGDAASVLNVGAGTGSYEPRDRRVVALDPSPVMLSQRAHDAAPAVSGVAEALPFPDRAFDATLATLTLHHWRDLAGGLAELRRVARRAVVFTFDTVFELDQWIVREYLPEMTGQQLFDFPVIEHLATMLDATVAVVPIPRDCSDGFTGAYWARPEAYLDPAIRAGMSAMQTMDQALVESRMTRLAEDLASGAWDERHGHLRELDEFDLGYRLLVTR